MSNSSGVKILALSGSLRAGSSNTALLEAVGLLAPPDVAVEIYDGLGLLPPFNPDLDESPEVAPDAVRAFRTALGLAHAVVISCPEYAHGVPGAFKNALDWIVSSGELLDKPVLLLNASPSGGELAQASLVETLKVMTARVDLEASRLAPFLPKKLSAEALASNPETARALRASLTSFLSRVSLGAHVGSGAAGDDHGTSK